MAFRVLIFGNPHFREFTRLHDALDAARVDRLPDVQIVTFGGPGLPALAASYARSHDLELLPVLPDRTRYPGCAEEKRDERLVEMTEAVIVAGEVPDEPTRELLARLSTKCVPIHFVGARGRRRGRSSCRRYVHGSTGCCRTEAHAASIWSTSPCSSNFTTFTVRLWRAQVC